MQVNYQKVGTNYAVTIERSNLCRYRHVFCLSFAIGKGMDYMPGTASLAATHKGKFRTFALLLCEKNIKDFLQKLAFWVWRRRQRNTMQSKQKQLVISHTWLNTKL